jgi:predicted DNA-binding transcriptional regulator AlpA
MKLTRTLLRLPALLDKLGGVSAEFVDALIANEDFPKPLAVSRRVLLWDQGLVDEWIERKGREAQQAPRAA